jgi:hypothetical protein
MGLAPPHRSILGSFESSPGRVQMVGKPFRLRRGAILALAAVAVSAVVAAAPAMAKEAAGRRWSAR